MEPPNLRVFSFSELMKATNNFKLTSILGEGAFGRVYKGTILAEETSSSTSNSKFIGYLNNLKPILQYQDHRAKTNVAVKRLSASSFQGLKEWQNEVALLGSHWHPNLVKLIGYCCEDKELLLVYEYMPKGSLDNYLYKGHFHAEPLGWGTRASIALGVARALAFLHAQDRPIIFTDLKSSDILLDQNFNVKISDFGFAKIGPADKDLYVSTPVVGSCGIGAPEYVSTGHLYVKSDVYRFGVVLFELLHATTDHRKSDETVLKWEKCRVSEKKKMEHIMENNRLQNDDETFEMAAKLTLRCLRVDHKARPAMTEVVEILECINNGNKQVIVEM